MKLKLLYTVILLHLFSCDNIFEYSIYTAKVDEDLKNTTNINLENIHRINKNNDDTFSFAVIGDVHNKFDN